MSLLSRIEALFTSKDTRLPVFIVCMVMLALGTLIGAFS